MTLQERRQKLKSVNSAEHLPGRERIPAPQKDEGTSSQCSDENENVSPNKCHALPERNSERGSAKVHYSRKVAPTQEDRQNAALQRYVSIMRAHFEEVLPHFVMAMRVFLEYCTRVKKHCILGVAGVVG